jgi:hypothetical protein
MTLSSVPSSSRHHVTLKHWELPTQWYKVTPQHPGIFNTDFYWMQNQVWCHTYKQRSSLIQLQLIYMILIQYLISEYNNVASIFSRYMSWQLFQLDRNTDFDHKKCSHLSYLQSSDFRNQKFCNKHNTGYNMFLITHMHFNIQSLLTSFIQLIHIFRIWR